MEFFEKSSETRKKKSKKNKDLKSREEVIESMEKKIVNKVKKKDLPVSWAETARQKRNKRENDIIAQWDNNIFRKAQRLFDSTGDELQVTEALEQSGFDEDDFDKNINFSSRRVKKKVNIDDFTLPQRIKKRDFKEWREAGIRIDKIEQLVRVPLFQELYPQHLLTHPFEFVILERALLSYKVAKQIAIDRKLKVSPEIRAQAWVNYEFQDVAYKSDYQTNRAIEEEFGHNNQMKKLVLENMYKTKSKVKTIDWSEKWNKYYTHYNYYYTSNTIRQLEKDVEEMVRKKLDESTHYSNTITSQIKSELPRTDLAPEQRECIETFFGVNNNNIGPNLFVLTGGPGTGKTASIKTIIKHFQNHNKDAKILTTALSGMAVTAIDKSMKEVTNINKEHIDIGTIHKQIIYGNKNKKDSHTLVIVDETTMVNMYLVKTIMDYVTKNENCIVIFVGDVDQLPAIGAGQFFKDIINKLDGLVMTRLNIVHRYNDDMKNTIQLLKNPTGEFPESHSKYRQKLFNENTWKNSLEKMIHKHYKKKEGWQHSFIVEWQILSAQNKGLGSVSEINRFIQNILWKSGHLGRLVTSYNDMDFYIGDKVINCDNDYNSDPPLYNGQMGIIHDFDEEHNLISVKFDYNNDTHTYDTTYTYTLKDFKYNVILAYATTVHKSQGSGFENVCLIMSPESQMWSKTGKSLLYTGASRVREKLIIYTTETVLDRARKAPDNTFTGFLEHDKY